ncbi:MAG: DinB family protein [Actinomycetota bacterium]|nr:DinB family protein [Actinomycetota bacterium]
MTIDWTAELLDQLDGHWTHQLRPRLAGLTDEEYFWEPVEGCWNIRPRGEGQPGLAIGRGPFTFDLIRGVPTPGPVTTIGWRLAHLSVSVLGGRVAGHFGGPPISHPTFEHAGTAEQALAQLDEAYAAWIAGVGSLDEAALAAPCGPSEGQYADEPMLGIVLHISREVIAHGAEICLLRDLYLNRSAEVR